MHNLLMKLFMNYKYGITIFYIICIILAIFSVILSIFCWNYNLTIWLPYKLIPIWICIILGIIPGISWIGIIAAFVTYIIF